MKKVVLGVIFFVFVFTFFLWGGVRINKSIDFTHNMMNNLKLTADANTAEMAKPKLDKAIKYLESHGLTEGVVSIFFQDPKNDIGFFYKNLKACQSELEKLSPESTQLEESNVLMKLRQSLLDEGDSVNVTCPDGMDIYPNNVAYFLWAMISFILIVVFGIWWGREMRR